MQSSIVAWDNDLLANPNGNFKVARNIGNNTIAWDTERVRIWNGACYTLGYISDFSFDEAKFYAPSFAVSLSISDISSSGNAGLTFLLNFFSNTNGVPAFRRLAWSATQFRLLMCKHTYHQWNDADEWGPASLDFDGSTVVNLESGFLKICYVFRKDGDAWFVRTFVKQGSSALRSDWVSISAGSLPALNLMNSYEASRSNDFLHTSNLQVYSNISESELAFFNNGDPTWFGLLAPIPSKQNNIAYNEALSLLALQGDIRYTIDGSEPTETSTLYTAPFIVFDTSDFSQSKRIRAKTFHNAEVSAELDVTYTQEYPEIFIQQGDYVSLYTNGSQGVQTYTNQPNVQLRNTSNALNVVKDVVVRFSLGNPNNAGLRLFYSIDSDPTSASTEIIPETDVTFPWGSYDVRLLVTDATGTVEGRRRNVFVAGTIDVPAGLTSGTFFSDYIVPLTSQTPDVTCLYGTSQQYDDLGNDGLTEVVGNTLTIPFGQSGPYVVILKKGTYETLVSLDLVFTIQPPGIIDPPSLRCNSTRTLGFQSGTIEYRLDYGRGFSEWTLYTTSIAISINVTVQARTKVGTEYSEIVEWNFHPTHYAMSAKIIRTSQGALHCVMERKQDYHVYLPCGPMTKSWSDLSTAVNVEGNTFNNELMFFGRSGGNIGFGGSDFTWRKLGEIKQGFLRDGAEYTSHQALNGDFMYNVTIPSSSQLESMLVNGYFELCFYGAGLIRFRFKKTSTEIKFNNVVTSVVPTTDNAGDSVALTLSFAMTNNTFVVTRNSVETLNQVFAAQNIIVTAKIVSPNASPFNNALQAGTIVSELTTTNFTKSCGSAFSMRATAFAESDSLLPLDIEDTNDLMQFQPLLVNIDNQAYRSQNNAIDGHGTIDYAIPEEYPMCNAVDLQNQTIIGELDGDFVIEIDYLTMFQKIVNAKSYASTDSTGFVTNDKKLKLVVLRFAEKDCYYIALVYNTGHPWFYRENPTYRINVNNKLNVGILCTRNIEVINDYVNTVYSGDTDANFGGPQQDELAFLELLNKTNSTWKIRVARVSGEINVSATSTLRNDASANYSVVDTVQEPRRFNLAFLETHDITSASERVHFAGKLLVTRMKLQGSLVVKKPTTLELTGGIIDLNINDVETPYVVPPTSFAVASIESGSQLKKIVLEKATKQITILDEAVFFNMDTHVLLGIYDKSLHRWINTVQGSIVTLREILPTSVGAERVLCIGEKPVVFDNKISAVVANRYTVIANTDDLAYKVRFPTWVDLCIKTKRLYYKLHTSGYDHKFWLAISYGQVDEAFGINGYITSIEVPLESTEFGITKEHQRITAPKSFLEIQLQKRQQ